VITQVKLGLFPNQNPLVASRVLLSLEIPEDVQIASLAGRLGGGAVFAQTFCFLFFSNILRFPSMTAKSQISIGQERKYDLFSYWAFVVGSNHNVSPFKVHRLAPVDLYTI
jgi:hypothetical protein